MKTHLRALLALPIWMILFSQVVMGQAGTITVPANNATNVGFLPNITVRSSSTGNNVNDPDIITIEVCSSSSFNPVSTYFWGSNDIYREDDVPNTLYSTTVTGLPLSPSTTYFVRAYSSKDPDNPGPTNSFTTQPAAITGTTVLSRVNSVAVNFATGTLTCFANRESNIYDLSQAVTFASSYEIQFDIASSFSNPLSVSTTTTSTTLAANYPGLVSGQTYFVRVRGVNAGGNGPFGSTRRYVNALHPCKLETPTGTIARFGFKIWTLAVANATNFYFQVDTLATFATPHVMTGNFAALNFTDPSVVGNVFRQNYTAGGAGRAFNYLTQIKSKTYYVRVRAYRNSLQPGYWSTVQTITPNPIFTAAFISPANAATNVAPDPSFSFYNDPNYIEQNWHFQLSTSASFATTLVNDSTLTRSYYYYAAGLPFNRTYYARVRSKLANNTRSAWATISFSTPTVPLTVINFPTNGTVFPNYSVWSYARYDVGITQYDWQVERLTGTQGAASFANSTTYHGQNFPTFLKRGQSYRIRVRGTAGAQSITGVYSPWVNFSIAASNIAPFAPSQDGVDEAIDKAPNARLGVAEEASTGQPSRLAAWPNPTDQGFTLSLPTGTESVSVHDLQGRLVEQIKPGDKARLYLGERYQPGTYLIQARGSYGARQLRQVRQ